MLPRTLLTALLLSTVAAGFVAAAESLDARGDSPVAAGLALGADPDSIPVTAELVGWLRGRPLLGGLLLAGAAAVGLVLARAGYRRARSQYRAYTSPTVVLLDEDLEEFEWDDPEAGASDPDGADADDRNP